jgi:hypothetical protein
MRSGHPSVIKDLNGRVDAHVHENRRFTIDELHEIVPNVSRSVLYEIVTVQRQYKKFMLAGFQECSQLNTSSYRLLKWSDS